MLRSSATLLLLSSIELGLVYAAHLPGYGPPVLAVDVDNNIINKYNDRYTVALNVSGTLVNVILDTGSSDLWLASPQKLGPFTDTGVVAKMSFGDGSTFVNGTIGLGPVEFVGFDIPKQAFLNVTENVGFTPECNYAGICGLIGLGFDNPRNAVIPNRLTQAGLDGNTIGKSALSNIFSQQPNSEQFFAFSLSRAGDLEDSADASLTIAAYDDDYAAVQYSPKLPQFPKNSGTWSILAQGIAVENKTIPWTSYSPTTPSGELVVLLDTGTTNFLVPAEVRDAIYSAVPGAVVSRNSSIGNAHFSEDRDVWVIPCTTAINFTTSFGGQTFTIHPLDLTDFTTRIGPDGKNYTVCSGSITNGGEILGRSWDALYGDSFLRNTYTVFAFGNETVSPYVQLLSQNDGGEADTFNRLRARLLANSPPELSPKDLIALFDGPSPASSAVSSRPSSPPSSTPSSEPSAVSASTAPSAAESHWQPSATRPADSPEATCSCAPALSNAAGKASVNLADNDTSTTDSQVSKYGPVIVGLLAANLVLLLVLAFLGVMGFVRNGRKTGPTRSAAYAPVKIKEDLSRQSIAEDRPYSD
ncbi:aspartic peptidase domain-containing protein [Mycena rebaudengoi]|nr:aspartic peptidase domain-containing protein [Mycena rebaudengoi]